MKHSLHLFWLIILLSACGSKSPYPGFSKDRKGFYYQLHSLSENPVAIGEGDYITADFTYMTIRDSVFFEGRRKIKLEKPAYEGAVEDCIRMLHPNESATFILAAGPFFKQTLETDLPAFLDETSDFKIRVDIIEVQSANEFEKEKLAFLNWIDDFGDYEKEILRQYLMEERISVTPDSSGLICIPVIVGTGPNIERGDTITINYEGRFLNGKFFDSTVRRNQPFQFVFGTEWQVIKGIEQGLSLMREGEKALFIMTSELAFGDEGSSTGIIPPFTSLVFEVEIVKVSKGPKQQ